MGDREILIRDFIYLDWEKIRSIAAQVFEGLPEDKKSEKGEENIVQSEVGTNLWLLKSSVGGDLRYFNSEHETRSLHHYIYYLVEQKLQETGSLIDINSEFNFDNWNKDFFYDGQFVKIEGLIRLIDFDWLYKWMANFQKSVKTIQLYELNAIKEKLAHEAKKKEHERHLSDIRNLKLDDMKDLMQQFFGDTIRIKVVPNISYPQKIFVGSGEPKNFNETGKSLSEKYGYDIDAHWIVFGQVNLSRANHDEKTVVFPTGNKMEDALEGVVISLNEIQKTASHIAFPAIPITPISIYRTNLRK